jgi:hypothetical protein
LLLLLQPSSSTVLPHFILSIPFQIPMSEKLYCYHCRTYHPKEEMRQIDTKGGKRWRCIKSIEATKQGKEARAAFGRQTSEINKAEARAKLRMLTNPEKKHAG